MIAWGEIRAEDWQPGDPLPDVYPGIHSGPIFKLKDDHPDECERYGDGEWAGAGPYGDAMRWRATRDREGST